MNVVAVLAALGASFIIGGIWFGVVVARVYVVALGREHHSNEKPGLLYVFGPVICNVFVVISSAILLQMLHVTNTDNALAFGSLVGVGYLMSTVANVAINPNFPRPFLYTLINAPYFITSSIMTSVILVAMA